MSLVDQPVSLSASAAVTPTPMSFDGTHGAVLREARLDVAEIVDVISAAAFLQSDQPADAVARCALGP